MTLLLPLASRRGHGWSIQALCTTKGDVSAAIDLLLEEPACDEQQGLSQPPTLGTDEGKGGGQLQSEETKRGEAKPGVCAGKKVPPLGHCSCGSGVVIIE